MARTLVSINDLSLNAGTEITKTTVDAGATGASGYTISGVKQDSAAKVFIENSGSATGVYSIKAGAYHNNAVGDLSVTVGVGVTKAIELDGQRYRQSDGSYDIDFGATGIFYAVQ